MKTELKFGNAKMMAETIAVNVLMDEIYEPLDVESDLMGERFVLFEMDGYYIVMHEGLTSSREIDFTDFKAFITEKDAFDYLELLGIEREEDGCCES